MTAVVKHISVHPNYRRCRVVGIFDDVDKVVDSRQSRIDRHRANKQAAGKREKENVLNNSVAYYRPQYIKHTFPEHHSLHGLNLDDILNLPDDPQ